jgi:hypothetical protein
MSPKRLTELLDGLDVLPCFETEAGEAVWKADIAALAARLHETTPEHDTAFDALRKSLLIVDCDSRAWGVVYEARKVVKTRPQEREP